MPHTNVDKAYMMLCIAVAVCVGAATGCRTVPVPAIDQSGQQIFSPIDSTTLVNPFEGTQVTPGFLQPAWQEPPTPPDCNIPTIPVQPAPIAVAPAAPTVTPLVTQGQLPRQRQGTRGSLILNPVRLIAPINTEVILKAGLCGENRRYVTKQPLDWILSQDSVGQFVAVGQTQKHFLTGLHKHHSGIRSSSLAETLSSTRGELITRGTPTPNDDMWIGAGQSWVSLSSSTEGTSRVTVVAPNGEIWDQRRQTATVYWIDAQWQPPTTAIAEAGQPQILTTVVTRSSDGSPLVGWIVRYEIVGSDGAAGFAPSGGSMVEVATDPTGSATAQLEPRGGGHGSTQVRIQIIRPAQQSGDLHRLTVGEEYTVVSWRAADLAANVSGPQTAGIDSTVTYNITISNPGDLPAHNVTITGRPTRGLEVVNAQPTGTPFGDQRQWTIGDLPPRTSQAIQVNCKVNAQGRLQYCVEASSDEVASVRSCAETNVQVPAISLQMQGPEQQDVGKQADFQVRVTNQSSQTLNRVRIRDEFGAGLEHESGQASPVGIEIGQLGPGKSWTDTIRFEVRQPGVLCHTVRVTADGGHQAIARSCLTAREVAPPPKVEPEQKPEVHVSVTGPKNAEVGKTANFVIRVTNTGNTALSTVHVLDIFSGSFEPKQASANHQWYQGGLLWTIPSLDPGKSESFEISCQCLKSDAQATHRIAVSTDQQVSATNSITTNIAAPVIEQQPDNRSGQTKEEGSDALPPASGSLELTVTSLDNPIQVGDEARYLIQLTNDRDASDKQVEVVAVAPAGMRIKGIRSQKVKRVPVVPTESNEQKWVIRFQELRARETVDLKVSVEATEPGMKDFVVRVRSLRSPQARQESETTEVNPK